jgi:hypothetical protein
MLRFLIPILMLTTPALAGELVSWDVQALSYVHNLEFFEDSAEHQEGRTYFGQHFVPHAIFSPAPDIRLAAGVVVDMEFGRDTSDNWDAVEPMIYLETDLGSTTLRFGNMDRRRQRLHPALIAPEMEYDRPADRGLSVRAAGERWRRLLWIQWRLQERVDRRELFDVGVVSNWDFGDLTIDLQGHIVHRGGQLSSVGLLEESWGVLVGPTWRPALGDSDWHADLSVKTGATADRRFRHDGRGHELVAGVLNNGLSLGVSRWWGDEFATMDGRRLYQLDDVTSWNMRYRWRPGDLIDADFGVRVNQIDGDMESEFWLIMDLVSLRN